MNRLHIPGEVYLMSSSEFVTESLNWVDGKRVLLVMNSSQDARLHLEGWVSHLNARSLGVTRVRTIPPNPDVSDVERALHEGGDAVPDLILAVGGGSTIDVAKALSALWYMKGGVFGRSDLLSSIQTKQYLRHATEIPIWAVPTTAGTGSEVTRWATIWDKECEKKLSVDAPWLCPTRACEVPEFTISMPPQLTLSTGLDALCHAVEAYWAKSSNPMLREISKTSVRLIVEYLPGALSSPRSLINREKMCLGSLFSGLAFSHTRTTACHSISYPLTARFGIEHGIACALSLSRIMSLNFTLIPEPQELFAALRVRDVEELQEWLEKTADGIVRLRLSSWGVQERDIPSLVEASSTAGRMDNNPVEIGTNGIRKLLQSLL